MKRFMAYAVVFVGSVCFASGVHGIELDGRYQIKSFIAEYDVSGSGMGAPNGTETLYVDHSGGVEARYSDLVVSVMGMKQENRSISLLNNEGFYHIEPETNIVTKIGLDEMIQSKGMKVNDYRDQAIKDLGGELKGKDSHLGKACNVIVFPQWGTEICEYKGVPLKYSVHFAGINVNYVAKSFKENVSIPLEKVSLPPNARIQEAPQINKMMGQLKPSRGMDSSLIHQMQNTTDSHELSEEEVSQKMMEARKAMQDMAPNLEKILGAFKGPLPE